MVASRVEDFDCMQKAQPWHGVWTSDGLGFRGLGLGFRVQPNICFMLGLHWP